LTESGEMRPKCGNGKRRQSSHSRLTLINIIFQYAQTCLLIVNGIVLTPLYLACIPERTFGAWLATGNIVAWLTLIDPGINQVVQQRVAAAHAREDRAALGRLRTQSYILSAGLGLFLMTLGLTMTPLVRSFVDRLQCESPADVMRAFHVATIASGCLIACYGATVINIGMQCPAATGMIYLASQVTNIAVVVGLLLSGVGVVSLPAGVLGQAIVLGMGNALYTSRQFAAQAIPASFSWTGVRGLLMDSTGTALSRLASVLSTNIDMALAACFLGPEQAVALSMTQKGPGIARTFVERPSHAAVPSLAAIHAGRNPAAVAASGLRLLVAVIWVTIPAATATILFNRSFVSLWVGADRYAGPQANVLIAIALVAGCLEVTLSNMAIAVGLFRPNGRIMLIRSMLSATLATLGAWAFGMAGLLAAPLIAGATTTLWLLPKALAHAFAWDRRVVRSAAREAGSAVLAATLAAAASLTCSTSSVTGLAVAIAIFGTAYACAMLFLSVSCRHLVWDITSHRPRQTRRPTSAA
jgi:O-antigen/teichoic acid export membrane protein